MGIQTAWADEAQTAIVITFQSPWNWEDFSQAYRQMIALLDGADHVTAVILDIRHGGFPPSGAMKRFKQVAETKHDKAGTLIFVAPKLLTQVVRSTLELLKITFLGAFEAPDFNFVSSLDDALKLASEIHPTVPKKP